MPTSQYHQDFKEVHKLTTEIKVMKVGYEDLRLESLRQAGQLERKLDQSHVKEFMRQVTEIPTMDVFIA